MTGVCWAVSAPSIQSSDQGYEPTVMRHWPTGRSPCGGGTFSAASGVVAAVLIDACERPRDAAFFSTGAALAGAGSGDAAGGGAAAGGALAGASRAVSVGGGALA